MSEPKTRRDGLLAVAIDGPGCCVSSLEKSGGRSANCGAAILRPRKIVQNVHRNLIALTTCRQAQNRPNRSQALLAEVNCKWRSPVAMHSYSHSAGSLNFLRTLTFDCRSRGHVMQELLSPKQVAASIGVSESSLKRWCDQGVITTEKTPGGHRRIRAREVVRFLREQSHPLVSPETLGLPSGARRRATSLESSQKTLLDALEAGDHFNVRRVVLDHYLAGASLVELCERLLVPTLYAIGDRWECGTTEVYQERRACESINGVLFELRSYLSPPATLAPVAIGGSPPGDHYRLPTLMVELVLAEAGWNATSLGSSLPFATMAAAARRHKPHLFWLSVSHCHDPDALRRGFGDFLADSAATLPVAVGGRVASSMVDAVSSPRVHTGVDLTALLDIARRVHPLP